MVGIIDCGSSKVPLIESAVNRLGFNYSTFQWDTWAAEGEQLSQIIVSGAPKLLTEIDHAPFLEAFKTLLQKNRPVLGICFGHQMMGLLHKASVYRCEECREDMAIKWLEDHPVFKDFTARGIYMVNQDHCEAITLPDGFQLLASSKECAVEAMSHNTEPWYGVQFHPESSSEEGRLIIDNFLEYYAE